MGFFANMFNKNNAPVAASVALQGNHEPSVGTTLNTDVNSEEVNEQNVTWVQGHARKLPSKSIEPVADSVESISESKSAHIQEDGSSTMLGHGFASSNALSERGFREGSKVRNTDDLNMSLVLLTCEYQSHIQNQLDSLADKLNAHMQGWSRMSGVSEAYDNSMKRVIEQIDKEMEKYRAELSRIDEDKGNVKGIHIAYKRGYVQAIELSGRVQYYDAKAEK